MLTAQKLKETVFEKAIFGGYDSKAVDDFMEDIIAEVSVLQKENIALKQKLKELTDKNEEYALVENSMRKALISAQAIATEMVEKAENQRDKILSDASEIANEQITTYRMQIIEEQEKLKTAQEKTSIFISNATAFFEKQLNEFQNFTEKASLSKEQEITSFDDFTIEIAPEKLMGSHEQQGEQYGSITENILEKIKKETITPKVVSEDTNNGMNFIDLEDNKSDTLQEKVPKFTFSELKFGKDYSGE